MAHSYIINFPSVQTFKVWRIFTKWKKLQRISPWNNWKWCSATGKKWVPLHPPDELHQTKQISKTKQIWGAYRIFQHIYKFTRYQDINPFQLFFKCFLIVLWSFHCSYRESEQGCKPLDSSEVWLALALATLHLLASSNLPYCYLRVKCFIRFCYKSCSDVYDCLLCFFLTNSHRHKLITC